MLILYKHISIQYIVVIQTNKIHHSKTSIGTVGIESNNQQTPYKKQIQQQLSIIFLYSCFKRPL